MAADDDPFTRPPRVERQRAPSSAPPPSGPRYDDAPAPVSGQAPSAGPAWNAQAWNTQAWKRRWGVTFKRWGVALLVNFAIGLAVGFILIGTNLLAVSPDLRAEYGGALNGGPFLYLLFFAWWLDHLLAGVNSRAVVAIHAGGAGLIGLMGSGSYPSLPAFAFFASGLITIGAAYALASVVKDSFEPTTAPAGSGPASPGPGSSQGPPPAPWSS